MQTKTNLPSPTGYAGIVTKPPGWHTLVVFDILFNNLTTGLFLVAVDADALGDALRWEPSRNDELFPHLYGELDLGAVTAILDMRARSDGTHDIPELEP